MRVLVTGADGFTGLHLTQAAIKAGYEVIPFVGDLQNASEVHSQVRLIAPTHAIHLAAISHVMHADEQAFYGVNVIGTVNLLSALAALPHSPKKVILASSANVYGNCLHSPIGESEPPAPVNHYAMSKLAMEFMARNYLAQLPIVITRPFNYTGVGHHTSFVIPKIISHLQAKASSIGLGNIDVLREYNDVRDVCQCYLGLLTAGQPGQTYNIASGRTVSLRQVIAMLESMAGFHMPVHVNPNLIRPNEIRQLAGNGAHLQQCIGSIDWRPLDDTLRWMLDAAH
jgi:nucleoside-diphosphate-sugar epimerase